MRAPDPDAVLRTARDLVADRVVGTENGLSIGMHTSMKRLPLSLGIVTSLSLALAGCFGREQGTSPLPDDYAEADKIPLRGVPLSTDDAECGTNRLTFAALKAQIPNRRVLTHRFTLRRSAAESDVALELQADLTAATCIVNDSAVPRSNPPGTPALGGVTPDYVQMRGMLRLAGADGLLDVRLPTSLLCSRAGSAIDCAVFADGAVARNRGTYVPPSGPEGGKLSVRGTLERGLDVTWLSGVMDDVPVSDAELPLHVDFIGNTKP